MDGTNKRFVREFMYAMAAYFITIWVSVTATHWLGEAPISFPRVLVSLLPVIPVIFMLMAFMRYLNSIDELQQRIQLQAIGFSAGATALLTFSYGFLETVGFPSISLTWVFPLIVMLWGMGNVYFSRKYQ